jgi:hypothetical protein
MDFGLDDWIYWHLIHTARDYRQYSALADLHSLQFTVTHTLGFSVFTSCILATELQQSHCHFKSHMKSSFHSLPPFLPLFCNCQFRGLNSARIPVSWHPETRLFTPRLLFYTVRHFLITTLHEPRRKHSLYYLGSVLLICCLTMVILLLCVFASAGVCLQPMSSIGHIRHIFYLVSELLSLSTSCCKLYC